MLRILFWLLFVTVVQAATPVFNASFDNPQESWAVVRGSAMLDSAVRHNGFESYFAEIISADRVKTYKPSPRVYALGPEILNLPAAEILFVSSNSWDAVGAKALGYAVCWCNRSGASMDDLGFAPDFSVRRLDQLL